MVTGYVPAAGDIVLIDFDLQVGHQQPKRRPALVLTDQRYNRASGLAVVCPLTSKRRPYTFALSIKVNQVEGAVLGSYSIILKVHITDHAGRPLVDRDVEGKVRFFGENLRVTYDFSKKVAAII